MNLDDFNISKLKTKYQRLRFVLIVLVGLISGFLIWKNQIIFSNYEIHFGFYSWERSQNPYILYSEPLIKTFEKHLLMTALIGSIICTVLFYYVLKLIEWINKEDKL